MTNRFKIEDLVSQDATGVVFRAIDSETNMSVAIRRFFPAGTHVSGMSTEEQQDYHSTVERLTKVSHPALRRVIGGGCDPVDGMPYIATEWIEGAALDSLLETRPLSETEATMLITQALDVCLLLSKVLGSEDVWVEADVHTIIIGAEETQRPVTFWIYPFKLRSGSSQKLKPLIALTNSIMGWEGKSASRLSDKGLEAWLKWLHGAAKSATLRETREMLTSTVGTTVSQPSKPIDTSIKPKKSKLPMWIFIFILLIAAAAGVWIWTHKS